MSNFKTSLVMMLWLVSLTGCSEGAEVESSSTVGGIRLIIPEEYLVVDQTSFLASDSSGLDNVHELLIKLPLSELGIDDPNLRRTGNPSVVMLRLVAAVNLPNKATTDAQHAWYGTGLYQDRVIENDPEVGMTRIYPKSGYPLIWNYFRGKPASPSSGAPDGDWVANCRLQPGSTETSVANAQCISEFFWKSVKVELAFPGSLIQEFTSFLEVVTNRLDAWEK